MPSARVYSCNAVDGRRLVPLVGALGDPDVLGVALPLQLVLADDLLGDPRIAPLDHEADFGPEQMATTSLETP